MLRRLGKHAERAAKAPADYIAWLGSFEEEHRQIVTQALAPAVAVASGRPEAGPYEVERLLRSVRTAAEGLADTATPSNLAAAVAEAFTRLEEAWPDELAGRILGEPAACPKLPAA